MKLTFEKGTEKNNKEKEKDKQLDICKGKKRKEVGG